MSLDLLEQSVQYAFKNEAKYGKNGKKRVYSNIDKDVSAEGLMQVGNAFASLQGDELERTVLITKNIVNG